jgi:hypothetical protein
VRRRLTLLFLAAFVIRVIAILVIREYERPNTWESGMVADALLRGDGFALDWRTMLGPPPEPNAPSTWWPPAYPLFLAACRLAAPASPWLLASLIQAVLLALVPVLLFHMGRALFGETAGWIAAVYAALHPPLVGYAALIQTAAFEIFAMTAALALITRVLQSSSPLRSEEGSPPPASLDRSAFLAGLAIAVAALIRGPALALLVIAPIAWLAAGTRPRRVLRLSLPLLAGALLLIGPWTARNYQLRGSFVLISSKSGWNLFRGNNSANVPFAPFINKKAIQPELREKLMGMNEVEGDRCLRSLAFAYMRAEPGHALQNMLARSKYLLWFNEGFGRASGYSSFLARATRPLYMTAWVLLVALSAVGLVRTRRSWRRLLIFYGTISVTAGVILLTYFENRYRAPLEPVLILFVGAALAPLWDRLRRPREAAPAGED